MRAVDIKVGRELWVGEERDTLEWKDISKTLVQRRAALQEKFGKIDYHEAKAGVINAFHVDESKIVDRL